MKYETETTATIEACNMGELIRFIDRNGSVSPRVWIRGAYDRTTKRYSVTAWDDMNRETFKAKGTRVNVGFTF